MNRQLLLDVLQDEAMARCRYEIYAEKAHSEGLHYYAKILEETAHNELSHFRELMDLLGLNGTTETNLQAAIQSETEDSDITYPRLHDMAVTDNSLDTARLFQQITKIESRHKERFEQLLALLQSDMAFRREEPILWKCRVCGYVYTGETPPKKCPACQSPGNSFEPDDFAV